MSDGGDGPHEPDDLSPDRDQRSDGDPGPDRDPGLDWDPWLEASDAGAASLGVRAVAFMVDWTLLYLGMAVVIFVAVYSFGLGRGQGQVPFAGDRFAFNVVAGAIETAIVLAYFGVLEHRTGQTLGKRLFGLEVADAEGGGRPSLPAALTRRLPFVVGPLLPGEIGLLVLVGVGVTALLTAAKDRRGKQAFHDRWAHTIVLRVR